MGAQSGLFSVHNLYVCIWWILVVVRADAPIDPGEIKRMHLANATATVSAAACDVYRHWDTHVKVNRLSLVSL
jgi:hypothetical protein